MNFIITLLSPSYWIQNNRFSNEWDKKLNKLMDENRFELISSYKAKIGDVTVWIGNHPYASFSPYECGLPEVRPSRATIRKAMKKLEMDVFSWAIDSVANK